MTWVSTYVSCPEPLSNIQSLQQKNIEEFQPLDFWGSPEN